MADTSTPGTGSENPFGNGAGNTAAPETDAAPGALTGAVDGESHESEGGKWTGLNPPASDGGAVEKSSFKPGSAT